MCVGIAIATAGCGSAPGPGRDAPRAGSTRLPVTFEADGGRSGRPDVRLIARGRSGELALADGGPRFTLSGRDGLDRTVTLGLVGARSGVRPHGTGQLGGVVNSYEGADASRWRTGLKTFGSVRYDRVWPGIDMVFHGARDNLEYDFVVSPGANPEGIAMRVGGDGRPRLGPDGRLVVSTDAGSFTQDRPVVYQVREGRRVPVASSFVLRGREVRFRVGDYDRREPLVIDPVILYSTFDGGASDDEGADIAVGPGGEAVVAGTAGSSAYVTELTPAGDARVFTTYLGGDGADDALGVAVDAAGRVVATGGTSSSDFPTTAEVVQNTNHGDRDAFVSRLSSSGALVSSTLFGGASDDAGLAVTMVAGGVQVAGSTTSTDFPLAEPRQEVRLGSSDAFYLALDSGFTDVAVSSYFGGDGDDAATALAHRADGTIVLGGVTTSPDLQAEGTQQEIGGGRDAFVAGFAAGFGDLEWLSYHGGGEDEEDVDLALDPEGNVYVSGTTRSEDLPVGDGFDDSLGGNSDAFLARFGQEGDLRDSTFIGANGNETGEGVAVGAEGRIWLTGTRNNDGDRDAVVWRVRQDFGTLLDTTVLQGADVDDEDIARAIAVDGRGDAYVTGSTRSADFPTLNAVQPLNAGRDAFITKLADADPDTTPPDTAITSGPSGPVRGSSQTFTFSSTEPMSTFLCALDGAAPVACAASKTFSGLTLGGHTLSVAAVDPAGNVDQSATVRSFTVYAAAPNPPNTIITRGAFGSVTETTQTFAFVAIPNEPGVTFECSLDLALFTPCTSPTTISGLSLGSHTFRVRLVDAGGVPDPTPASTSFRVVKEPETTITSAPTGSVQGAIQRFTFTSDTAGATFLCQVDDGLVRNCSSPYDVSLTPGDHVFSVTAQGPDGVRDRTPATAAFEILPPPPAPPNTVFTSTPGAVVEPGPVTFGFSTLPVQAGVTFECALDDQPASACTSPQTPSVTAAGSHKFSVTAIGADGARDATPAVYAFEVRAPANPFTQNIPTGPLPVEVTQAFTPRLLADGKDLKTATVSAGAAPVAAELVMGSFGEAKRVVVTAPLAVKVVPSQTSTTFPAVAVSISAPASTKDGEYPAELEVTRGDGPSKAVVTIRFTVRVVRGYNVRMLGIEVSQGTQKLFAPGSFQGIRDDTTVDDPVFYEGITLAKGPRTIVRAFADTAVGPPPNSVGAVLYGIDPSTGATLAGSPVVSLERPKRLEASTVEQRTVKLLERAPLTYPGKPSEMHASSKWAYTFVLPFAWSSKTKLDLKVVLLPPDTSALDVGAECSASYCASDNDMTMKGVPFRAMPAVTIQPLAMKTPKFSPPPIAEAMALAKVQTPLGGSNYFVRPYGATLDMSYLFANAAELFAAGKKDGSVSHSTTIERWVTNQFVGEVKAWSQANLKTMHGAQSVIGLHRSTTRSYSTGTIKASIKANADPLKYAYPRAIAESPNRQLSTLAHELGHQFGRQHAGHCPDDDVSEDWPIDERGEAKAVGIDRRPNSDGRGGYALRYEWVDSHDGYSKRVYDYMSYCSQDLGEDRDAWMSPQGWDHFINFFTSYAIDLAAADFGTGAPQFNFRAVGDDTPRLAVDSVIGDDGVLTLGSPRPLPPGSGGSTLADPSSSLLPGVELIARDASGNEVGRAPVGVITSHVDAAARGQAAEPLRTLQAEVAAPGARALDLVRGTQLLARSEASPTTPVANLAGLGAASKVLRGPQTVRFTLADPDPSPRVLDVDVAVSGDGGRTWRSAYTAKLAGGAYSARLAGTAFPRSDNGRIRVTATDGFSTGSSTSGRLRFAGSPPIVSIDAPKAMTLRADQTLSLTGMAFDNAMNVLPGKRLVWRLDGKVVDTGRSIDRRDLTAGRHRVTLQARDRVGAVGRAKVMLTVKPVTPRFVILRGPGSIKASSKSLVLRVSATTRATLRAGGRRFKVGATPRRVRVPVRPGSGRLFLKLRLVAGKRVETRTVQVARG